MPRIGETNNLRITGWKDTYIGEGKYALTLPEKSLTMTGSAVTKALNVPSPFQLIKVEVKHTKAAAATDSADALTWSLKRKKETTGGVAIISYTASTDSDFVEEFGENYSYDAQELTFSFNTTNTDLIFADVVIKKLEA